MTAHYPNVFNLRLSNEDLRHLEEISKKLDTPRSTLIRQVWREWLASQAIGTMPSTQLSES